MIGKEKMIERDRELINTITLVINELQFDLFT